MGAVELPGGWPTRSQLEATDFSYFGQVADWLGKIRPKAEGALEKLAEDVKRPGGVAWEGAAGNAAIEQAATDLLRARSTFWSWDDVRQRLPLWQDNLEAGKRLVFDAIDDAKRDGFVVSDDYTVTDTRTSYASQAERDARQAAANGHAAFIRHRVATLVGNQSAIDTQLKAMTAEWGKLKFPDSGGAQALDFKQGPGPQEPQPKDNPDPPWKDRPPPKNWEDIKKTLDQLQKGANTPNRQLDTPEEIKDFWDWLSKGAKGDLPSPGFPRKVFDDGTEIGMRPDSESGGPTIDFKPPDSKRLPKVHLPLPPPPAAPPAVAPPAAAPESPGPSVASQIGHDLESAGKGIWSVVVIAGGLLSGIFGGTGGRVPTP